MKTRSREPPPVTTSREHDFAHHQVFREYATRDLVCLQRGWCYTVSPYARYTSAATPYRPATLKGGRNVCTLSLIDCVQSIRRTPRGVLAMFKRRREMRHLEDKYDAALRDFERAQRSR